MERGVVLIDVIVDLLLGEALHISIAVFECCADKIPNKELGTLRWLALDAPHKLACSAINHAHLECWVIAVQLCANTHNNLRSALKKRLGL